MIDYSNLSRGGGIGGGNSAFGFPEPDENIYSTTGVTTDPSIGTTTDPPISPTGPATDPYGSVASLGYGDILKGSSWEKDWEKFFDPYDPTKERMFGQQYQTQLGDLFAKGGLGTQNLMQSWAGGGQAMTGRKNRQRRSLGKQTALGGTRLFQGFKQDVYGEQQAWQREQRGTLNMLLGQGIWPGTTGDGDSSCPNATCPDGRGEDNINDCSDTGTPPPPPQPPSDPCLNACLAGGGDQSSCWTQCNT